MTGATPLWDPHFIETLEGSFSSVSTATIARVGAFFRVFQDLQDLHSFAPLSKKKLTKKNLSKKSTFFVRTRKFCFFHLNSPFFAAILMKNTQDITKSLEIFRISFFFSPKRPPERSSREPCSHENTEKINNCENAPL